LQWVVPKSWREQLLALHHDTPGTLVGGHLGCDKLFGQLLQDYWWSTLYKDVEKWVNLCKTCQEHSNPHGPTPARQQLIKTMQALEKMGMDLIGLLLKSKQGHVYALVMQDYFTKWPKAIPLKEVLQDYFTKWPKAIPLGSGRCASLSHFNTGTSSGTPQSWRMSSTTG